MKVTKVILDEWKSQAKAEGNLDEYKYHLSMIYPPLPYGVWKLKKASLDSIQSSDKYDDNTMKRECKLCNELGY